MEVKWDFTSSESELSGGEDPNLNGGWRENSNGHHNSSEKKRGRQKMLSFSARDQVRSTYVENIGSKIRLGKII